MKTEEEIKRQLEEVYEYRLRLRIGRKTKPCCRNCVHGVCREFDLGDFGTMSRWECRDGRVHGDGCGFECSNDIAKIEEELLADISEPSVCGAKEPKIAMLLWVLHNGGRKADRKECEADAKQASVSFWGKIKHMFD